MPKPNAPQLATYRYSEHAPVSSVPQLYTPEGETFARLRDVPLHPGELVELAPEAAATKALLARGYLTSVEQAPAPEPSAPALVPKTPKKEA